MNYLNYGNVVTKIGGPTRNGDYDWLNVKYQSYTGWVATNWLQQSTCPSTGGSPPPAPGGSTPPAPQPGTGGCAPPSSTIGKAAVFTYTPSGVPLWQPYGRTSFSWNNCAKWYSASGCMHMGLDFGYPWATDVPAVCSGWITSSTDNGGANPMSAGPKSVVQHCGDWLVLYGHMSSTNSGFKNAGEIVGKSGDPSGCNCGNNHLHLEVRQFQGSTTYSNRAVNPVPLFVNKNGITSNAIVCGDSLNQPDVTYGSTNKCTIWCGCPGYAC
jgi:murein DD-endopeptidase MepM/ murein hydrolase activator NlpD